MNPITWSTEQTDLLKLLWEKEGWSGSRIAAEMTNRALWGRVTRNAVIGKVHRLNLKARLTLARTRRPVMPRRRPVMPRAPRAPKLSPAVSAATPQSNPAHPSIMKHMADLDDNDCRYPSSDPGQFNFGFCGLAQADGSSYCAEHHALTHMPYHGYRN